MMYSAVQYRFAHFKHRICEEPKSVKRCSQTRFVGAKNKKYIKGIWRKNLLLYYSPNGFPTGEGEGGRGDVYNYSLCAFVGSDKCTRADSHTCTLV